MPKTDDPAKRAENARKERDRITRIKNARLRLEALPAPARDAVIDRAEAAHNASPRVAAVAHLEAALDAHDARTTVQVGGVTVTTPGSPGDAVGRLRAAKKQPAKTARPKGPREKSTPKEKGRPKPETKKNDADALAGAAAKVRGGEAAIVATVHVSVPDGTRNCPSCGLDRAAADFWPKTITVKSKPRATCRECYNREWREWKARQSTAATA